MDVLILNGALAGDAGLDDVHATLTAELAARGHVVRSFVMRDTPLAHCRGCFECWVKTPGVCRTKDAGRDIARAFITSHAVCFVTPVTFGGYSSELKKALDRCIGLVSPFFTRIKGEVHHRRRYDAYPRLLVVGLLPAPNEQEELVFHSLALRNALNMHAPWYACRVLYRSDPADGVLTIGRAVTLMENAA